MRVLLDENVPEALVAALRELGHEVDSVNSLGLKGLDDATLYQTVAQGYDLFLTRDVGFVNNVRNLPGSATSKLLRITLPQQPARFFVEAFVPVFHDTDWSQYEHCHDWP